MEKGQEEEMMYRCREKKGISREAGEWDSYRTSEHAALWPKLQLLSLPALSKPHRTSLFKEPEGVVVVYALYA